MRIIAGSLRGRDLGRVPDGVRPTTDRVRESLFASLGDLSGRHVLDLFAGTGALGLEAYSRGAERVVFVERSRRVARALRSRLARLGLEAKGDDGAPLALIEASADRALRRLAAAETGPFDLALLDPPYEAERAGGLREETVVALFGAGVLGPDAMVVVEGPTRHPLPPLPGIRVADERRYGDTTLTWLMAASADQE